MKRKMLMSVLLSFAVCCAYSFEPSLYVMDELRRIQTMNELRYHYAWGLNIDGILLNTGEGIPITQTHLTREFAWFFYKKVADEDSKPRTIAEVELMALFLWEHAEYELIASGTIMREEK